MVHLKQGLFIVLIGCACGLLFNQVNPMSLNIRTYNPFPDAKKEAEAVGIKPVGLADMADMVGPGRAAPGTMSSGNPAGTRLTAAGGTVASISGTAAPGARVGEAGAPAASGASIGPSSTGNGATIQPQAELMHLDKAVVQSSTGSVFVDARTPELFAKGRIQFAINLPETRFDEYYSAFAQMNIPKNQAIVVYCDGQACLASNKVAELLRRKGYTQVMIFFGGWEEWRKANAEAPARYPIEFD